MLSHFLRAATVQPPPSNITFVGTSEAAVSTNTNSLSIAYPAGTQNGDVALICITTNNNMSSGYSATGWTSLDAETGPSGVKCNLLRTVVSGTGTQSFTKGSFDPGQVSYILAVFRGATYSSFSLATGSSGAPNPPSRTGSFNAVVAFGNSSTGDSSVTPPTGYTTLGEINNTSITTMGGYLISSSTNPDPAAFTNINSANWIAYTIGLT
jgi:hypothetical protein